MGFDAKRRQHEAQLEVLQRGGRVIGSPMSPTPEPEVPSDREKGKDKTHHDPSGSNPTKSPKKKKKKKHHRKNLGSDEAETAEMAEGDHARPRESKKKHKGKKKSRSNKPNGVQSPNALEVQGSPPSAQQPTTNGISEHTPTFDPEGAEPEVDMAPLKTEPDIDMDDVPDNELPFRIADNRIVDGYPSRQKSPFIHKRRMSITDGRSDPGSDDEAPLPDLQPSQAKPEPPSSESESDLASPSVARLARLSRSRSRSVSRPPPPNKPTDESRNAGDRAQSITPSRSSTGSNQSIPARTQDPRPVSRASTHSSGRHVAQVNGDAMDVDGQDFANGHASPPRKQARRPKSARKPKNYQHIQDIMADARDADEGSSRPPHSHNAISNTGVDKVSGWLAQPARRRTQADEVEESDHDAVDQDAEAAMHDAVEDEEDTEQAIQSQLQQQAHVQDIEAPAAHEPEVSASQPKKAKKKRRLQSTNSLSLSQLEDDFGEGENQSRMSLSQKSKLKDVMLGDRNSAEGDEPSQEPNLPKQTKPKRKRRTNEASEDEMENLLAGPSRRKKSKKSKKSSKSLGADDNERTEVTPKRNRQSQGEVATGPWTTEELTALGQVVDQFRRAHDMDQQEVNAMIHERPEATNPMHQEFWDNAVNAIPNRNRKQIVERTRRLYNNFVGRGRWSEEQKQELHALFEERGNKFAEISALINRDQKDIRDYWRNHYVVFEHQRKYYWKPEETEKLKQAVDEALNKIRIDRENNDQFRPRPRAKGFDDESLLDWEQISAAIGLTRSRQQCRWKWQELKDKGAVGEENDHLPEASLQLRTINGLSEVLANAREDYRVMSVEDQLRLIEAVHDSGHTKDSKIKWKSLVDEQFRAKWLRPTLKLVWFRLRKTVPDHEEQDIQSNARYLLNYYNNIQSLPRIEDHQADDQVEEKLVNQIPGSKVWQTPSQEPRAVRERQRRSSSASSRASSRPREKVSSQILRIPGGDDGQPGEPNERGRDRTSRSGSVDLGHQDVDAAEEEEQPKTSKRKGKGVRREEKKGEEGVPVRVPMHLNGAAAEEQ